MHADNKPIIGNQNINASATKILKASDNSGPENKAIQDLS